LPSAGVLPTMNTFCPQYVVAFTATDVLTAVHPEPPDVRASTCRASIALAGTVALNWPLPFTVYVAPVHDEPFSSPLATSQYVPAGSDAGAHRGRKRA
jgi:hypothetical protein